jgi:hypothetical protein
VTDLGTTVRRNIAEHLPDRVDLMLRAMPRFIIIGTQRGGTTSLYDHLTNHPQIRAAKKKEVHFFDNQYHKGLDWYRGQFPRVRFRRGMITGEATPYYLFHPEVPGRIEKHLPKARFIAILRDPVSRAYSHHHVMHHRRTWEPLPFDEAVRIESKRLEGEADKLVDPTYRSEDHQHRSYVSRGIYVDQLLRWTSIFPREQILVLRSEDLYADPANTLAQTLRFIGLEPIELGSYAHRNISNYPDEIDLKTRAYLKDFYRPHNERLFEFLGRDLGWND